jgi:hypothetical protein
VTGIELRGAGCGCALFCLADLLLKANPELFELEIFTSAFVDNGRGFDFVRRPFSDLAGRVHRAPAGWRNDRQYTRLTGVTQACIPVFK